MAGAVGLTERSKGLSQSQAPGKSQNAFLKPENCGLSCRVRSRWFHPTGGKYVDITVCCRVVVSMLLALTTSALPC